MTSQFLIPENLDQFSIEEFLNSSLRLRISDILESPSNEFEINGENDDNDEESLTIRTVAGKPIQKVCIMGTLVQIQNFGEDAAFYVDDGTERALIRIRKNLLGISSHLHQWDVIKVVGSVSIHHDPLVQEAEIVIDAEIIRPADSDMEEFLHRLDAVRTRMLIKRINELRRLQAKAEKRLEDQEIQDARGRSLSREEILSIIKHVIQELDVDQKGVSFEQILSSLAQEGYVLSEKLLDELILDLMDDGELFEPRAGYYQLVY